MAKKFELISPIGLKSLFSILLVLIYILAKLNEGYFWAVNHIVYLDKGLSYVILFIALLLIWFGGKIADIVLKFEIKNPPIAYLLMGLMLVTILIFPTESDAYGDGRTIIEKFSGKDEANYLAYLKRIFDPNIFNLHNGEYFNLALLKLIQTMLGVSTKVLFRLFGFLFAIPTILIWLKIALRFKVSPIFTLLILFVSNGFSIFFGHPEIYASSVFFISLFLFLLFESQNKRSWLYWLSFVLCLLFAIKSHFINVLLVIPFGMLIAKKWKPIIYSKLFNYNTLIRLIAPIGLAIFLAVYIFIFKNHTGSYFTQSSDLTSNIFLPIIPDEPPFDNYYISSFYHVMDMFTLLFGWALIPFVLFIHLLIKIWNQKNETNIVDFELVTTILCYLLVFFFLNPILGMSRDWDLFSIGSPLLIAFWIVWEKHSDQSVKTAVYPIVLAVFLFIAPKFWVESNKSMSEERILDLGIYSFNSYYAGSVVLLSHGVESITPKDASRIIEKLENMQHHDLEGNDIMKAHFASYVAKIFTDQFKRYDLGLRFFELSAIAMTNYPDAVEGLAICYMYQGKYEKSLVQCKIYLDNDNTNPNIYKVAINCLMALNREEESRQLIEQLRLLNPKDESLNQFKN